MATGVTPDGPAAGRPLTARSVVASTLLGTDPPRLPVARLLRVGELFGLGGGAVRTALSRMVGAGELVRTDDGWYELSGALVERQHAQRASRRARVRRWSGRWQQAVVVSGARSGPERAALRRAMARLRLSELRDGVWLRPDNLDPDRWPGERALADSQCRWFASHPDDDAGLAAQLWDLDAWAAGALRLRRDMHQVGGALAGADPDALRSGFVVSAAVLRHLGADPLLPRELWPRHWPAEVLRRSYEDYDRAYRAALRDWFDAG